MNVFEDGDKIFIFGFSRGAYTARALAGALHMFGLLCPGNEGLIPYIITLYAKRTRKAAGMTHTFNVAAGFKETFCRHCPVHFVGVWDTVSSVGWIWDPLKLPYTGQNPDIVYGRATPFQLMNGVVISEITCGEIRYLARALNKFGLRVCIRILEAHMRRLTVGYPRSLCSGCFVSQCRWG